MPTSLASDAAADADLGEALAEQVRAAAAQRRPLRIVGGDSKAFYGRAVSGETLALAGHRGILSHDPSELVVVARAGTPVAEIEARLAGFGQRLGFEPPILSPASTIGGVVATGLAGPRRGFAGAPRDFLLGAKVLDGQGQALNFGGTVFKNVAGFDGFRLMAGAQGCLGVILEVALRVTPLPQSEITLAFEMGSEPARAWLTGLMRRPLPLSGAFHDGARLHLRLSGGEAGVAATAAELGGEAEGPEIWPAVRDLRHPVFAGEGPLWRLSTPQTAALPDLGTPDAWDWGGAQRWLASERPAAEIRAAVAAVGGHATLFRGAGPDDEVFHPLPGPLMALHQRLKAAFDPARVLNPGRLYAEL